MPVGGPAPAGWKSSGHSAEAADEMLFHAMRHKMCLFRKRVKILANKTTEDTEPFVPSCKDTEGRRGRQRQRVFTFYGIHVIQSDGKVAAAPQEVHHGDGVLLISILRVFLFVPGV